MCARKRLDIFQRFADRIQNWNPTDAEKINEIIVSIIDEISNLSNFYLDVDTKIKIGRLGRELYEESEMVQNASDSKEQYKLSQAYAPGHAVVKVGSESEVIYRGDTSTGGISTHSRPYLFLNSSLKDSLVALKKYESTTLSDETYFAFEKFLGEINEDLKLESRKNVSDILVRMGQTQDRRNVLVPSRMARLRNFLLRRKPKERLTPEEIVIQQRIEHAEQILRN